MIRFVLALLFLPSAFGTLTFKDYCLDESGQLKKASTHPAMYIWNVHDYDMLMTCPPTTVWYQPECACLTLAEIEEEEPEGLDALRLRINKALAGPAATPPSEAGALKTAQRNLIMNFDNKRLADESSNKAYVQRKKNVRVTRRGEGVNGNAAKFRSGYLKLPMFNNFRWGNAFTVCMWIKPDIIQDGFYGVFDNAAVSCKMPSSLFIELGKQSPSGMEIYAGMRTHTKLATLVTYLPYKLVNRHWLHICLVFDGEVAEMFIQGKLRTREDLIGDVRSRNCPLVIGWSRALRRTQKFRGLMDQIYILKYSASKQDIRYLYQKKAKIVANKM